MFSVFAEKKKPLEKKLNINLLSLQWEPDFSLNCFSFLSRQGLNSDRFQHVYIMYSFLKKVSLQLFSFGFTSHSIKKLNTACSCLQKCDMYLRVGSITADLHFPAAAISGLVCEKNSFNGVKRSFRVRAIFRSRYLANVFFPTIYFQACDVRISQDRKM